MNKSLPLAIFGLMAAPILATASILFDFTVPAASTAGDRARYGSAGIEWNFSIDGAGNVALASVTSSDDTPSADVNGLADSSLVGATFTLTTTAVRDGTNVIITGDGAISSTPNGALGVFGGNASLIDGAAGPNNPFVRESLIFTLTSSSNPDLVLNLTQFAVAAQGNADVAIAAQANAEATIEVPDSFIEFQNLSSGFNTISAGIPSDFAIGVGGAFIFTNDLELAKNEGYALDSITFSAIPEPSTYGFILGAIAFGLIVLRRKFH